MPCYLTDLWNVLLQDMVMANDIKILQREIRQFLEDPSVTLVMLAEWQLCFQWLCVSTPFVRVGEEGQQCGKVTVFMPCFSDLLRGISGCHCVYRKLDWMDLWSDPVLLFAVAHGFVPCCMKNGTDANIYCVAAYLS